MNRYRIVLLIVGAVIAAAIAVALVRPSAPPTLAGTGSNALLIPVDQRSSAPELLGVDAWINSPPLSMSGLRGRVVLVDFWTFSCVNCVRTIPHLQQLYGAYRDHGFVIVGVHSPEFDFEKVPASVGAAVQRLGVTWPVALDSEMATWNAYSNQYWPAEYLIDQQGHIAYVNFGEGNYEATDSAVAMLLGVKVVASAAATPIPTSITPELYAGSARGRLVDGESYGPQGQPVDYPDPGPPQTADLIQVTGTWIDYGQYLQAGSSGHVRLRFRANNAFVVVGSAGGSLQIQLSLDGANVPAALSGSALTRSMFTIVSQDLYQLIEHLNPGYHLVNLLVPSGFRLYTFTFG